MAAGGFSSARSQRFRSARLLLLQKGGLMNKKEVAELKRRFKKDHATFSRMAVCYVDGNRNKVCEFGGQFLTLEEEEYYKYLEIANKVLSGTMGNNLLNLEFPLGEELPGGRQQILMALRDSKLEDENLLETWYDLVIDSYDEPGNYLIILFLDNYDVMTKTKDNIALDESEEVFTYLLAAICPVALSKPALSYLDDEQRIGPRIRDWVVGMPDTGFLFPAFNDRSTDIHSTLFYTKNTKEPHAEFMANGLGCGIEHTATEQKLAFHSIVRNVLGAEDDHTTDVLLDIQQNLSDRISEYVETHDEDAAPMPLDMATIKEVLEESQVKEAQVIRISNSMEETFGDKLPTAENVVDSKALAANEIRLEKLALEETVGDLTLELNETRAQLQEKEQAIVERDAEIRLYTGQSREPSAETDSETESPACDVELKVHPEKAPLIQSRIIDGRRCLIIPVEEDEQVSINGDRME